MSPPILFQVTLVGFDASEESTDDRIFWFFAPTLNVLNDWMKKYGFYNSVDDINMLNHPDYSFDHGVDAEILQDMSSNISPIYDGLESFTEYIQKIING